MAADILQHHKAGTDEGSERGAGPGADGGSCHPLRIGHELDLSFWNLPAFYRAPPMARRTCFHVDKGDRTFNRIAFFMLFPMYFSCSIRIVFEILFIERILMFCGFRVTTAPITIRIKIPSSFYRASFT
jgi:hypothetical protein